MLKFLVGWFLVVERHVKLLTPDFSVAALGVSLAVALANTPTVGRLLSTIPMAS